MIDMHTHILPGIDDGAKNVEETIRLIEEAKEAGFTGIVLTSHYIEGHYAKNVNEREELITKIDNKDINLYLGNEIYLSDNIIELINEKKISSINNTRYLLFEMPFGIKPMNLYEVVYEMMQYKYIPILAHPERYSFVIKEPELIYDLIEKGVLMQANYGSIIGQYGKKSEILVKKLLENNMIHFLGSDVHRENTIYKKMPEILLKLNKLIGEEAVIKLSDINPNKVLNNEKIDKESARKFKYTFREKLVMK